jgi:hypothetical protein
MDINRELAELLGLCWHEYDHWEGRYQVCRCGVKYFYSDKPVDWANPNFTTDSGKIELLRLMKNQEDWRDFLSSVGYCASIGGFWNGKVYIPKWEDWISVDLITDTTGLLAQAAREFLRKEGEHDQGKGLRPCFSQSCATENKENKQGFCSSCGATDIRIEGHHFDYSKPFEITWLCYLCHKMIHKEGEGV